MALAGDHLKVLVGGYELTGDGHKLIVNDQRNTYEVTAFGDVVHTFIPGARLMTLDHAGYMNAAAARSHPVLKSAELKGVVTVMLGQNADPEVGDPIYSLYAQQGKYGTLPEVATYIPFRALFASYDGRAGWGVALAVPVSFTNSTSGSVINNGAESIKGGAVSLHILQAAAADTYTLTVEGSTTGAFSGEQTTLATFSLNASALGAEFKTLNGTIAQYTRWKAVRSGSADDPVRAAVSLIRY